MGNGLFEIDYKVSGKAPASSPKTVYDPGIISDAQILDYGKAAVSKEYSNALAIFKSDSKKNSFTGTSGGINFKFYLGNNKEGEIIVTNIHPIKGL